MSPRSGFQTVWLALAVAVIGVTSWLALKPGGWLRAPEVEPIAGAVVQRGPLRISVVERGNLEAADSISLKSEIEGTTTILWLIEEGVHVEEGDLLCELDVTPLIDRKFDREISVRDAEADFIKSKQAYEIQKSQNESDIAKAEQNLTFAREDLRKFREGERDSTLATGQEAITLADEQHARAKDQLKWSQELEAKGFLTSTELEADRIAANTTAIRLEQAKRDFVLLRDFQVPRDESELVAGLAEAERELERVKLQAAARLVDYEAAMETGEAKFKLEKDKLDDLVAQIDKAALHAPRAGMVVYAKQPGGRYGRDDPIAEGTQVRERQDLITIPSAKGMVAEVSLHESVLKQVEVGQTCIVRVDAVPGREFRGHVSFVALLPDQQSWWANPNQRLYRTDVAIDGASPEMRPGMSCSIEILVEDIDDAIFVPVQSVFRHEGGNLAFVSDSGRVEPRPVEVGRYNDRWVQVLSGLSVGEVVLLSPPAGFTLKPAGEDEKSEIDAGSSAPGEGLRAGGEGGRPTAHAEEAGPSGGPPADQRGGGERPTAEQMEAFRAKMKAEGREMPSQEQIEKWRKQREGGSGGGSAGGAAAPSGGS